MAEEYKIDLGIQLNQGDLEKIKTAINNLVDKERQIDLNIDFKIKNADILAGIGREIEGIKQSLKELNNVGSIGKGKGKSILSVDSESLKNSINTIHKDILKIQSAFGKVDKNKGVQSLLTTINKIRASLEGVSKQFEGLNQSLSRLSGKDFNLSLDLGLGGTNAKNPNQLRTELNQLKSITIEYEKYIQKLYTTDKYDATKDDPFVSIRRLVNEANNPNGMGSKLLQLQTIMTDGGTSDQKIRAKVEAYRQYINLIKEAASIANKPLDSVEQRLTESGKFTNLKQEAKDVKQELKGLLGGIDAEGLSASLEPIVRDLTDIKRAFESLSSIGTIDGLTTSFKDLSEVLDKLVSNVTLAKNALDDGLGVTSSNNEATNVIQDQERLAQSSTQAANAVVQSEKRKQQAIKETSNIVDKTSNKKSADIGQFDDDISDTKELNTELKKLRDLAHQIGQLDFKIVKSDYKDEANQVKEFERQLELLKIQFNETLNSLNGKDVNIGSEITKEFVDARNKIAEFEAKVTDTKRKLAEKIKLGLDDGDFNVISRINAEANQLTGTYPRLTDGIQEVKNALRDMELAAGTESEVADVEKLISAHERFEHALRNVNNQIKENKYAEQNDSNNESLMVAKQNALLRLKNLFNENSEAAKHFASEVDKIQKEINECGNLSGIPNLNKQITNLGLKVKEAGYQTETFGQKLKKQFSQYSAYLSVASLISYGTQGLRDMFEQVKLIDSAMTELKKVTNETDASYNNFLKNAASRSKEIGTTIDGLVASTADFARLGYGFEDSQGLAEVANIYAVVGDEVDGVEGATESLISTMAAFKDEMNGMSDSEFAMSIIDSFNKLGNNFAISSGGLGEALERSASSLATANNSLHESAALITAAM